MANSSKRTVLVVEDNDINREMLSIILEDDYNVIQAENGKVGLDILNEYGDKISLVLLDINMPVMNGYEMMAEVQKNPSLSHVPIIVTTSNEGVDEEIKCLEQGASDFVTKPYNAEVVLRRVESMIHLREASSMVSVLEHDMLTGVLNREFFFWNAEKIVDNNTGKEYDIVCTDVVNFRSINEHYGNATGDVLLKCIGRCIADMIDEDELAGRLNGDVFAMLIKHRSLEEHKEVLRKLNETVNSYDVPKNVIKSGICRVKPLDTKDGKIDLSIICDRARRALSSVKDKYDEDCAEFDERVQKDIEFEQFVLDHMEKALEDEEFKVYYQPKHRLSDGKPGGAEALVRWINPERGFMNPGMFIPLFEKSRFISKLDMYMYEHVCRDIRRWIDSGIPAVPVSVNASRHDFSQPDFVKKLTALADKYNVSHELIHIEVTESAYTDNAGAIDECINKLHENGFKVELDDFGTGYSNLGSLNDLHFDVMKLDMSLVRKMGTDPDKNILDFIIELADMLHMTTVAEGAEHETEVKNLRNKGCDYIQGYYYSKPLPEEDFEKYLVEKS